MSAAGEIFEVLTLTYTDFKGKNGHRRRDTILTPLRPLLPKTVFLPSASRITLFLPYSARNSSKVSYSASFQKDPPTPGGGWVNRKGGPLRAKFAGISPYATPIYKQ